MSTIGSDVQAGTGVIYRVALASVPEPSTLVLVSSMFVLLLLRRRRPA